MAELVQEVEERNSIFLAQVCLTHAPHVSVGGVTAACGAAWWGGRQARAKFQVGLRSRRFSGGGVFFCVCVSLLIIPGPLTTAPLRA